MEVSDMMPTKRYRCLEGGLPSPPLSDIGKRGHFSCSSLLRDQEGRIIDIILARGIYRIFSAVPMQSLINYIAKILTSIISNEYDIKNIFNDNLNTIDFILWIQWGFHGTPPTI
jgi:hypothetical protein